MFENSNPLVDIVLVVQRTLLKMISYFKEYFFIKYGTNKSKKIKWVGTSIAPPPTPSPYFPC